VSGFLDSIGYNVDSTSNCDCFVVVVLYLFLGLIMFISSMLSIVLRKLRQPKVYWRGSWWHPSQQAFSSIAGIVLTPVSVANSNRPNCSRRVHYLACAFRLSLNMYYFLTLLYRSYSRIQGKFPGHFVFSVAQASMRGGVRTHSTSSRFERYGINYLIFET
jgi:hypothetical protein